MCYLGLLEKLGASQRGKQLFSRICGQVFDPRPDTLQALQEAYDRGDDDFGVCLEMLSRESGFAREELTFCLYVMLAQKTLLRYRELGIDEAVFYETLSALVRHCESTAQAYGVYGVRQGIHRRWYRIYFLPVIFRLGRLEFDIRKCACDMPEFGVAEGDTVLGVHIPGGESLSEEACEHAYADARVFFKKHFAMKSCVFTCSSWLLHPWLQEVLPETAAIVKFQKKFHMYQVETNVESAKNWIFPDCAEKPTEELEARTSLQRAALLRLKNGEPMGTGLGARW